jgi:hypothetical protein
MITTRTARRVLAGAVVVAASTGCAGGGAKQSTATTAVSVSSSTALPTTTTTSAQRPARATIAPVQTSAMPAEAFVAVGPALVAIDTHDAARRRTLTTFPSEAGINWVTADVPRGHVYFGVTSGCDPGVNGMYEMPTAGGLRRKIAPVANRVAISPDGAKLAYSVPTDGCGSQDLVVQDVASGQRQTFSGHRSIDVGGWSADGQSLFLDAYAGATPAVFRFRPFAANAQLDRSERWDTGVARDAGGGRVAILDWCSSDAPSGACVVGVRTRADGTAGRDYSFGRSVNIADLSIDTSGQWPLAIGGNPPHEVVSFFANGKWHELAPGNAADW